MTTTTNEDKNKPTSHETFVIGIDKDGNVIFFKSYEYLKQKDDAQSDVKWCQKNCASWHIGAATEYKLVHEYIYTYPIIIPHP